MFLSLFWCDVTSGRRRFLLSHSLFEYYVPSVITSVSNTQGPFLVFEMPLFLLHYLILKMSISLFSHLSERVIITVWDSLLFRFSLVFLHFHYRSSLHVFHAPLAWVWAKIVTIFSWRTTSPSDLLTKSHELTEDAGTGHSHLPSSHQPGNDAAKLQVRRSKGQTPPCPALLFCCWVKRQGKSNLVEEKAIWFLLPGRSTTLKNSRQEFKQVSTPFFFIHFTSWSLLPLLVPSSHSPSSTSPSPWRG